ncbi:1,4-beta-N-acetylmuramidase, partial [Lactobacillus nasalidis]
MGQTKHFQHQATLPALLLLLAVVVGLLAYGLYNYADQTTLPKGSSQSAVGIGLDQSQTSIGLASLQQGGLSFVYLTVDGQFSAYRKRLAKTKLAYGSVIKVKEQNSAKQLASAKRLSGGHWGRLPILLDSGQDDPGAAGITAMSQLAAALI